MKPDEPTVDDYAMMRIGLAAALKAEARRKTIPPLYPGGPGGSGASFEDLADVALGVFRSVMELMREQRDTAERGQDLLSARLERVRKIHHLGEWVSLSDVCGRHHWFRTVEPNPENIAVADVCPDCRPKRYMTCVCGETECEILAALNEPEEGDRG